MSEPAYTTRVVPKTVTEVYHAHHMRKVRFLQEAEGAFAVLRPIVELLAQFAREQGVGIEDVHVRNGGVSGEGVFTIELGVKRMRLVASAPKIALPPGYLGPLPDEPGKVR